MNHIFCHNCGAKNEDNAKYCENCGIELKSLEVQEKKIYVPIESSHVKQPITSGAGYYPSQGPKILCYAGCLCCVICIPFVILFAFISHSMWAAGSGSGISDLMLMGLGFILPCLISLLIVRYKMGV